MKYENKNKRYYGTGILKQMSRLLIFRMRYIYYILAKKGFPIKREIETKLFFGLKLKLPTSDPIALTLSLTPYLGDDLKIVKFLIKNVKENDIFYDVGANYGIYTALMTFLLPESEIHVFEPQRHIFKYLKINFKRQKIFLNNFALGNRKGKVKLFINTINTGGSTIIKGRAKLDKLEKFEKINMITLDEYVKEHTPPTIIKLDIEDSEKLFIIGGLKTLKKYKPIIIMEVCGNERWKYSKQAINSLLRIGYVPYIIDKNGEKKKISYNKIKKIIKTDSDNLVFI
ncbi:MAG: FkbM family methyltransferase [Candidatus Micrarchaeia archaeon]